MKSRQSPQQEGDSFRVIALVSAFNEGDVISRVIEHLVENGVDVYLLDNHSTDDTVMQASQWLGRGLLEIETFPGADNDRYSGAAERYDWTAILRRKEELARTLEADWFLHYDADEIRESPWGGVTLKDAIRFVDSLDYNCIDFRIFEFPPLDDGFRQGMDPRTYFTHFREAKDHDQLQLKCWKSRPGPVSLVHFGGHDVEFEGRRIFPIPFLLRHYPIRGQTHGQRKVFQERKQRFAAEERAKTWHRQYDHIPDAGYSFIVDPEMLRPFDLDRARLGVLLRNRDAAERKKHSETTIAELESKLGGVSQQLESASETLARLERESDTHIRGLEAKAGVLERQLETATASFVRREAEHQSALAQRDAALGSLERQVESLRADLRHSREELNKIYTSRTWRWGEPIGRFILTLLFMRRVRDGGVKNRRRQRGLGVVGTAAGPVTRKERMVNRLRSLKVRLGTGGAAAQLAVPLVEVFEFSLSHGLREVIIRARMRLRAYARRRTNSPAIELVAQPEASAPYSPDAAAAEVKLIAFYLPQYHPIPENDEAWGKGFTEWTNVTRARPLFDDHYQPHLPSDLGFYDLRVAETREEQARLAQSYCIYGFCYYYYWFDRRRLLSRSFDEVLQSGRPDFPFCICWANEPWSRRWDGSDHDVIASQDYRQGYADRFIEDVIPILRDSRYVRVDGRPLLIVYRIDHLPDASAAAEIWREACRREGLGEICLAAMGTYGTTDPQPSGFDLSIEFPPHNLTEVPTIEGTLEGLRKEFAGRVRDYSACAEAELKRRPRYPQFRGLMTSWDNTPRRGDSAMLFHNATPAAYEKWLRKLLDLSRDASAPHSPFIFINAWNEWAEGAHLEPDQKNGRAHLEATASALLMSQVQGPLRAWIHVTRRARRRRCDRHSGLRPCRSDPGVPRLARPTPVAVELSSHRRGRWLTRPHRAPCELHTRPLLHPRRRKPGVHSQL